ncbi:MAG: hypothetical protein ACI3XG_08085 [Faecousia sp.]
MSSAESLLFLRQRRKKAAYANVLISLAALAVGILLVAFLWDSMGLLCALPVLLVVVIYRVILGILKAGLECDYRRVLLHESICPGWDSLTYSPRHGVEPATFLKSGLFPHVRARDLFRVEHVFGQVGPIEAELCDVDFPLTPEPEDKRRFTGCFLHLTCPGAQLPELRVCGGTPEDTGLHTKALMLVRELFKESQGVYLSLHGDTMDVLLSGRILGFRPEMGQAPTEEDWKENPFPEVQTALKLIRLLAEKDRRSEHD